MKINNQDYKAIWLTGEVVKIIDQRYLPFKLVEEDIKSYQQMKIAIKDMHLRGAPLIGVAGAFGIYLAALEFKAQDLENFKKNIKKAAKELKEARPTAVNLMIDIDKVMTDFEKIQNTAEALSIIKKKSLEIWENYILECKAIGEHGFKIIKEIYDKNKRTVNILTHCNAGWIATIDYGTATSPIYYAKQNGIPVHVFVDETRPRNQGARLTAWELTENDVENTLIVDNTGGHLMQHGMVDLVLVGADRVTRNGDVANKIGTYLKALAAFDNKIPFYVAFPSSTFDFSLADGIKEIPIELRNEEEITHLDGILNNQMQNFLITDKRVKAANYAFDVTPARLISGFITEKGIFKADPDSIKNVYPEYFN